VLHYNILLERQREELYLSTGKTGEARAGMSWASCIRRGLVCF
jgi:hypothetical protein